jgi:tripartite ATP-independent transporter DctM subunit
MLMAMSMMIYKQKGARAVTKILLKIFVITAIIIFAGIGLKKLNGVSTISFQLVVAAIIGVILFLFGRKVKRSPKGARRAFKILWDAIPSLLLLIIVIGGIVGGFFTATEASAIAVLYAFLLALAYKEITIKDMPRIILNSIRTTSIVLLLVAASIGLSWIMAYENIPQNVSEVLLGLSDSKFVILLVINLILLVVGVFMDMTPAVLIFTPIFLPIVTDLGLDPVHFGIIMVLNLSVGLCTPPVGSVLFIGCSVANVRIERVIKPLIPMFIVMVVSLLLVTYIPEISMWFPSLFGV